MRGFPRFALRILRQDTRTSGFRPHVREQSAVFLTRTGSRAWDGVAVNCPSSATVNRTTWQRAASDARLAELPAR